MNHFKSLFLLAFLANSSVPAIAGNWYEGGDLHRSTAEAWKEATYRNKLATAGDWAIKAPAVSATVQRSGDINTLKRYAAELVSCIDTAVNGVSVSDGTSTIAASCMVLMGWLK
jgi:hypothetical protein